jgi:hypothetical protein
MLTVGCCEKIITNNMMPINPHRRSQKASNHLKRVLSLLSIAVVPRIIAARMSIRAVGDRGNEDEEV